MKTAARAIMGSIEQFTNLRFVEVTSSTSNILFHRQELGAGVNGLSELPAMIVGANTTLDVYIDDDIADAAFTPGGTGHLTLLHEIGHALGLKHPHEAGLIGAENSDQFTVMSYSRNPDWVGRLPSTYMLYDIAALGIANMVSTQPIVLGIIAM